MDLNDRFCRFSRGILAVVLSQLFFAIIPVINDPIFHGHGANVAGFLAMMAGGLIPGIFRGLGEKGSND
jgi:hypothetical protein